MTAPANLLDAFQEVRKRAEADGLPSNELLRFLRDPLRILDGLREDLMSGRYRPRSLRIVRIPKDRGGERVLGIAPFRDRVVQRTLHRVLVPILDPEFLPGSYGYRPGLGVNDAVDALASLREEGHSWVVRADFTDCFDSIDRRRLMRELKRLIMDTAVLDLLRMLVNRVNFDARPGPLSGRGVAQGSVISPLLANVYLSSFDAAMFRRGIPVVRYADDLAITARTSREAAAALGAVRDEADRLGLRVNETKTRVTSFREGVEFLGLTFTRERPYAERSEVTDPDRKSLFVFRQGAFLALRDGQVRVLHNKAVLLAVPVALVAQIVTFGRVSLSNYLRNHALLHGIDVVFLSRRGRYLGRLLGDSPANSGVREGQYRLLGDESARLRVARRIVAGKIANQRTLLYRRGRTAGSRSIAHIAGQLADRRRHALSAASLNKLRGIEGAAARLYFSAFPRLLPTTTGFEKRNRRPPRDPVNAALSFGYTLLLSEVIGACHQAGLDPHAGFLHTRSRGQPGLALDVIEEFRPLIVDTVVLEAFSRRTLRPEDFTNEQDRGCRMRDGPRKAYVARHEERMLTQFSHVPSRLKTTYRRALYLQARQIAAIALELKNEYEPVAWR